MLPTTYFAISYTPVKDMVVLLSTVDELDPEEPFTDIVAFSPSTGEWGSNHFLEGMRAVSHVFDGAKWWFLGDDGEVWRRDGDTAKTAFQLPDSGFSGRHLGQPNQIRLIGKTLHVCGFAGQVYRFDGKKWVHMDDGLAEAEGSVGSIDLESIDGTGPKDIYVVGSGGLIAHWDGKAWGRIKVMTNASLASVRCFSKNDLVAVGDNGVVVTFDGSRWRVDSIPEAEEESLSDVERFGEDLYVAGGKDLYVRRKDGWETVKHGLPKKKTDFFKLLSAAGRLWAMGSKRLSSFDGKKWETHPDPDNE